MNRNNIWVHLGIALVLIGIAGIIGQVKNWQPSEYAVKRNAVKKSVTTVPISAEDISEPEVLVKFRSGVSLEQIKEVAAKNHDRVEDNIEIVNNLTSIDDLDGLSAETVAEQYSAMTDLVEYAQPNYEINLDDPADYANASNLRYEEPPNVIKPNDPLFKDQWALNNVGQEGGKAEADLRAIKAWLKTQGSEDIVVAVLDTGVDYTHPDLVSNMWLRPENIPAYEDAELGKFNDLRGFNAQDNQGDPMDTNGHGTHCAGIIGAEGNNGEGISGINWKVQIMPLKFLGKGGFGTTKDAIEAINYAIDRKKAGVNIRIINASWGSTQYSKALEDAIRVAGENGILFVAAAGNSATNNDKRPHYPSNYDLPNVISVAALDRSDQIASFSNFGEKTVHIAAPGRDILSTWLNDNYREASGTSMATPYVAGVAALILADNSDMDVEKLREKLLKSVDKLDGLDGKVENGGRINAAIALGQ